MPKSQLSVSAFFKRLLFIFERRSRTGVSLLISGVLLAVVLTTVLAACSQPAQPTGYSYALTVPLTADETRAGVKARYGGDIVLWRPEAGFAVLGLSSELHPLSEEADTNPDALRLPESAQASGYRAWGGGYRTWGGGWSAWTGGHTFTTMPENLILWEQVRLRQAQSLAPHLGQDVKVAVIDTGLDLQHPAFAGHLAPAEDWWDFVDDDAYPQEVTGANYGHGTGVAGIILQLAPNVTLLPLRVLGPDGAGDLTDVVRAVDWAIERGARVINLSLGSDADFKTLKELLKYAKKKKVILVASAGNHGQKRLEYPARYAEEVVSVGSVDKSDVKSSFSAYDKKLALMAPGELIYTTAPDYQLAAWSGTSFAAPVATGTLALALGEAPYRKVKVKDLHKAIRESAEDISKVAGNRAYKKELGKGRLDAEAFLRKAFK